MDTLLEGLRNRKTTLAGTALGVSYYGANVGFQLPSNQGEWISFAISILLQVLGLLAQDATKK